MSFNSHFRVVILIFFLPKMKLKLNATRLSILLIALTFFGCKEQLFDSPIETSPTAAVPDPEPVTSTGPSVKWYEDVSTVVLPESNGKPVDPSFKRGNDNPTIVILGSATAEGVGASTKSKSWVELMKSKLKKDNKKVSIINMAKRKSTSYHIMPNSSKTANRPAAQKDRNITKALEKKPFLVIIQLTTNDINNGYSDDETLANYEAMRQLMVKANVNYIFAGPQPRNFSTKSQRNRLLAFNEKLIKWDPDHVVDVLKKLSQQDFKIKKAYAFTDGRNINDKGHEVVNGHMFNAPLFKHLLGYGPIKP
jgi:acyl-CoA thioesterase-1